jgi:hypothetical protein
MGKADYQGPMDKLALTKARCNKSRCRTQRGRKPYTSLNGHMFSMLIKRNLILRLPEKDRELSSKLQLEESCSVRDGDEEYVEVPDLAKKTSELKNIEISYKYIGTIRNRNHHQEET